MGPTIVAMTLSEMVNIHIWVSNTAAGIHLNGALLFLAGLAVVRVHNHWPRSWPVMVTLVGWLSIILGLFRMFAPEWQLRAARETRVVMAGALAVLAVGIFLTIKAYAPSKG